MSTKSKDKLLTADKADTIIKQDFGFDMTEAFAQGAASTVQLTNEQRHVIAALEATVDAAMTNWADSSTAQGVSQAERNVGKEIIPDSQRREDVTVSNFFSKLFS